MRWLILPLLVLGMLAAYVSGAGLSVWWGGTEGSPLNPLVALPAAAALHLAWLLCASYRRSFLVVAPAFYVSLRFSQRGLAGLRPGEPFAAGAFLIEVLPLLLAYALNSRASWSEWLAGLRRARADIALQLQMGDGILPWFRDTLSQFIGGSADVPVSKTFRRLAVELADVESRLGGRVASLAAPEQIRQYISAGAAQLLSYAEQSSNALAVDLERRTLALAAACREQCESLAGVPPADKQRLARQCEQLLFELIHPAGTTRALATVQH